MEKDVMTIGSNVPLSPLAKLFQTGEWSFALSDDVKGYPNPNRDIEMQKRNQEANEANKSHQDKIIINFRSPIKINAPNQHSPAWTKILTQKFWDFALYIIPSKSIEKLFSTVTFMNQLIAPQLQINTLRTGGGTLVIVGITILFTDYDPMMKRPALPVEENSNSTLVNGISNLIDVLPPVMAYDIGRQFLDTSLEKLSFLPNLTKDLYSEYKVGSFDAIERGLKKQENYTQLLEYIQQDRVK